MEYVLITGASSGIGRQCAIQLSENYNLVLCARREDELLKTRELCLNPKNHLIFSCDLSDVENLEDKLNNFLAQNNISVAKFLHCAGILVLSGAKAFEYKTCQNIFNINLFSAMAIVKVLLKKGNKKALNNVVFISALLSKRGTVGNSLYASSKGAIDSYMRCLAKEVAPKTRVNSILPGAIKTDITKTTPDEKWDEFLKGYPLGFGETSDIANMVEYLFSEKAKWITGQQISVDGGVSIS